ncbi:MAG: hypothetical protein ABJA82_10060 [Myxococcales bacterium]
MSAYVRYRSKTGCAYSWHTRKLALTGFPQGMTDLDESQIANAVIESANAWSQVNPALATCTDLRISVTMMTPSDTPPAAVYDHQNNVMFRHGTWCPDPRDANCRDPHALAITSVFARTSGEIVDADIEVNTMIFTWGDLVTEPAVGGRQDLQNALTHEMGHFIGFDHTCDTSSRPPKPVDGSGDAADGGADVSQVRPRDQNGDLVPYCTDVDLPLSVRMTTMFASSDPGDVSKRTLEDDDLQAVCHSYPLGLPDPESCSGSSHEAGGCAVAPEHGGTLTPWQMWSAAALGLLAVLLSLSPLRRARARVRSRRQRR